MSAQSLMAVPAAARLALITLLATQTAQAQVDIAGLWEGLLHEDFVYRLPGPEKGDYAGLPLTEAALEIADSYDPDDYYLPENQCLPHGAAYGMRGPMAKQILREGDNTMLIRLELEAQERRIYLDGRPWPGGELTWQGHSVGYVEGDALIVTTTHMKPRYIRRNGVPHSEDAVMTEYFVVTGAYLTLTTVIDDPLYLTEPLVRSVSFKRLADDYEWADYTCEVIEWPGGFPTAE